MANANGSKIMVNIGKKKRTHLMVVDDPGTRFVQDTTKVDSVTGTDANDGTQVITFTPKKPRVPSTASA